MPLAAGHAVRAQEDVSHVPEDEREREEEPGEREGRRGVGPGWKRGGARCARLGGGRHGRWGGGAAAAGGEQGGGGGAR